MAEQRRGEPRRHGRRGRARLGLLVLAVSLTLPLAACSDEPAGPARIEDTAGISGGLSGPELLIRTWSAETLIEVPGDVQAWIITWRFDAAGTCRQTVEVRSVADPVPRVTLRDCTYTADGSVIRVAYRSGGTVSFNYSFVASSPDRLLLDGLEYHPVP